VIDRDWRTYLDRKVVHFAYFYLLWVTIQFAVKAPSFAAEHGWAGVAGLYLLAFVQPFGTLWFIYLLPVFFVVTRVTRPVSPVVVWLVAAALEIAPIETGATVVDEFAARFVYFYTGYVLAPYVFALAAHVQQRAVLAVGGLCIWAFANGLLVAQGVADLPFVSLALGLIGAAAVVAVSALMAKTNVFSSLRYCGRHSIVIYLAFFLPMAATRSVLIKSGLIDDAGTISLLVTLAGVIGALAIFWCVRGTPLKFLFQRPPALWLTRKPLSLQPAE